MGAGPGCEPLLGQEASLTARLVVQPATPFLSPAAQPSSNPWVGLGGSCTLFGSLPAHLASATHSPTEQRNAPRRRGHMDKAQ